MAPADGRVRQREGTTLDSAQRSDRNATAWLALGLVGIAGLVIMTILVGSHVVIPFDKPFLDLASSWTSLDPVWNLFTNLGNLPMIPIGLGFVVWLWWKGRHREAIVVFLLLAAATATTEGLKVLLARPRPEVGAGGANIIPGTEFSYPSGHSLEDVMILGMVGLKVWRRLRSELGRVLYVVLAVAFVVVVEISRVALSSHYPSDMLAGIFGGFAAVGLYGWFSRRGGWADRPPEPERQ
ncbi:MAG TPA: phosphatase PAP2 family protein [Candidatus Dormibacteraeota bacterium]|nr:phosphatase PAP2 family protein [Candidatus Dormibacteraeota bacterium]